MAFDMPSIADNSIIRAIGDHLGMDGLFAASSAATPQAPTPPPPPKPVQANEVSKVRESKAVRQAYPQAKGGRGSSGLVGGQNPGMNMPGVMSPDVLMHPVVQQLLGQYGISPEQLQQTAQGASPNLFMSPSFTANHPHLGGALEGALEGAAFTKGGDTIGENISNVAQGMLAAKGARAEKYNNQLMMPFQQAATVAGVKTLSEDQAFKAAQAKHYQDLEDHYNAMDNTRAVIAENQRNYQMQRSEDMDALHRQTGNLALMKDLQATPFNADEQAQYQEIVRRGGGHPLDADPVAVQALINTAAQRKINEAQQGKEKVAAISGGFRVKAEQARPNSQTTGHEYADAQATWNAAQKNLNNWDKQIAATGGSGFGLRDDSGNRLDSKGRTAYRKKLTQAVTDAKSDMDKYAAPGVLSPDQGGGGLDTTKPYWDQTTHTIVRPKGK